MLSAVQTHWLDVCEYFTRVQCASTDEEERALLAELTQVEQSFDIILDALLAEKRQLEVNRRILGPHVDAGVALPSQPPSAVDRSFASDPSFSRTCASVEVTPTRTNALDGGDSASPGSAGLRSPAETSTTLTSTTATLALDSALYGDTSTLKAAQLFKLPPCYHYLFGGQGDLSLSSPADPPLDGSAKDRSFSDSVSGEAHAEAELAEHVDPTSSALAEVFPDNVASTFFLTLCLYAKHNQPAGARSVILRFLQDLLHEADLSGFSFSSGHGGPASTPLRSILQLSLTSSIVPLLDMIRKVGAELNPTNRRGSILSGSTSAAAEKASVAGDADRTAFVRLLCTLAERTEQVPQLANFFVVKGPPTVSKTDPAAATDRNESGDPGAKEVDHFVLLETLLPYMTHNCTAVGWEQRRDTCRYALSAVLSLAKCPDPWVRDLIAKETSIVSRTLAAARTTLLTLCKIPQNDDSEVQLLYLRDVLRFWSALCFSTPKVAEELGVPRALETDFALTTLGSLLMSPDSRVYSATCLVISVLLTDLQSSVSVVPGAIAHAVLAGVVDRETGRRSTRHTDFYRYCISHASAMAAGEDTRMAFFDYYVLSHLGTQPTLTEEDVAIQDVIGSTVTEWTAVEATLVLLASFAANCPTALAKYGLLTDINDMASTRRDGALASYASPGICGPPPSIDVGPLFSARLRAADHSAGDIVCGVSMSKVREEVLRSLLQVETNAPLASLREVQRVARERAAAAESPNGRVNCWFHEPLIRGPLTRDLSYLFTQFTSLPYRTALLLTQLATRICLQPDLRVAYTLLDAERGPLHRALRQLSAHIDHELDGDDDFAVAAAAATAAALSTSSVSSPVKAAAKPGRSSPGTGDPCSLQTPSPTYTRTSLYELYLQYWNYLPTHILSSIEDRRDTQLMETIAHSPSFASAAHAHTPPSNAALEVAAHAGETNKVSELVIKALVRHHPFLESCACLEQFRMELEAVTEYVGLSHRLMALEV